MKELLIRLAAGETLNADQARLAFEAIMTGQATAAQIGALLSMLQLRGPTVAELTGAARVMREKAVKVVVPKGLTVIDTCGTGGDQARTFNISTAAAIVAAAAGRPHGVVVAKHGNRSVSSSSGSSQVLEDLGVNLRTPGHVQTRCLDEAGLCFCFAPNHHPAMRHAAEVRHDLGFRTIFHLLGPLTNPAGAKRQLIGVFSPQLTELLAHTLRNLDAEHAMVVYGRIATGGGIDELSTMGPTRITELHHGKIHSFELDPTQFGLPLTNLKALHTDSPQESARLIWSLLHGDRGPARDIVCLNAAAALVVGGAANDIAHGLRMAAEAIDGGAASATLDMLIRISNTQTSPSST